MKITQNTRGYWQTTVYLGMDPTGKKIQKGFTGKTRSEVRERAMLWIQENQGRPSIKKISLGGWIDTWLKEIAEPSYRPSTLSKANQHIEKYIFPFFTESVSLEKVSSLNCQRFVTQLSKMGKAPKTVRNILGTLHSILQSAVKHGYLRDNPCDNMNFPKREKPEMLVLNRGQARALIADLDLLDPYDLAILTALTTGMRAGEIIALQWKDINGDRIRIRQTMGYTLSDYETRPPKNGKPRTIPYPDILKEALMKWKDTQKQQIIDSRARGLLLTSHGEKLSLRTFERAFKRHLKSLGLPEMRFHDLRHTFATLSLAAGIDPKTVSECLGHHSATFTLDVYASVTSDMITTAKHTIDSIF